MTGIPPSDFGVCKASNDVVNTVHQSLALGEKADNHPRQRFARMSKVLGNATGAGMTMRKMTAEENAKEAAEQEKLKSGRIAMGRKVIDNKRSTDIILTMNRNWDVVKCS